MTAHPIPGFQHFPTHHCVTGSLRHIYAFHGHDLSEDLLLGIGEGVSFSYWHYKGQAPFIGGRGMPKPSMEEIAGQRTGVKVEIHATSSAAKARQALLALLAAGQPVMLQVDMGFLPYFNFGGQEYHFGGHVVAACGYDADADAVLIADREPNLHPVPLADLEKARGSKFKPFPPQHRWYTFDFSDKRQPTAAEVRQAIAGQAGLMLAPPISNLGVQGIRKAGQAVARWADKLSAAEVKGALFNTFIFISPIGGSGGGLFRTMFSRFLREAAALTGDARLAESAATFRGIADEWAQLGEWFKAAAESPAPAARLAEAIALFNALAGLEEAGWARLAKIVA